MLLRNVPSASTEPETLVRPPATVLRARAVLFDMDGTLVDSAAIVHRAWQWWTDKHSIPLDAVLAVEKGRPNREVLAQFAPGLDIDHEARQFLAIEENDTNGLALIPGAGTAVRAAQLGLWAVVTSASRSLAEVRLGATGLPLPEVLITSDLITRGKPEPDGFLMAAARLGVEPRDCVVFEDAPAGILAAQRACMRVVGISAAPTLADVQVMDFRDVTITRDNEGWLRIVVRPFEKKPA